MESADSTERTGRRAFARLAGLVFANKVAVGFGIVIALLLFSVIIAGLGAYAARTSAHDVGNRHLPLMETALALEGLTYEAIFHVNTFGMTGDIASYSGARIRFAYIRDTARLLSRQAEGLPEGRSITRDIDSLGDLARRLDVVVEKKRTLNEILLAERDNLRAAADSIGDILLDLQARTASATGAMGNDKNLDEKARLLVLNGFALAVEQVTGQALAAGVGRSAPDLAKAEQYFAERWHEGRDACVAAAQLPAAGLPSMRAVADPAVEMDNSVRAFQETLSAMRYNLEESARLTKDRTEIIGGLAALTRGVVDLVRHTMSDAAKRAETALRGATVTLFACAILACALAVGAAATFARSRPSQ